MGLILAAIGLVPARARADEVKLDNGDVVRGEVTGADGDNVKLKHAYGQELVLPWKTITSVQTDKEVEVKLLDGSRLKGKLQPGPKPHTVNVAPDAEKGPPASTGIGTERIVALNEPPDDAVWTGRIALGITVSDGNTRSKTAFGSIDGERLAKKDRIELHAYYAYGESEGILATKKGFARAQYSYYFMRPLYLYAGGAFEYDEFQDLDLRSRGGGGLGWAIVESKDLLARVEAGAEYVNNDFEDPVPDTKYLALRFAGQFEWQVTSFLRLGETIEVLPSTEHFRDFTSRSVSSANLAITKGFGLAAIIIWQHVELPPGNTLRDDTTYILTLTYVF